MLSTFQMTHHLPDLQRALEATSPVRSKFFRICLCFMALCAATIATAFMAFSQSLDFGINKDVRLGEAMLRIEEPQQTRDADFQQLIALLALIPTSFKDAMSMFVAWLARHNTSIGDLKDALIHCGRIVLSQSGAKDLEKALNDATDHDSVVNIIESRLLRIVKAEQVLSCVCNVGIWPMLGFFCSDTSKTAFLPHPLLFKCDGRLHDPSFLDTRLSEGDFGNTLKKPDAVLFFDQHFQEAFESQMSRKTVEVSRLVQIGVEYKAEPGAFEGKKGLLGQAGEHLHCISHPRVQGLRRHFVHFVVNPTHVGVLSIDRSREANKKDVCSLTQFQWNDVDAIRLIVAAKNISEEDYLSPFNVEGIRLVAPVENACHGACAQYIYVGIDQNNKLVCVKFFKLLEFGWVQDFHVAASSPTDRLESRVQNSCQHLISEVNAYQRLANNLVEGKPGWPAVRSYGVHCLYPFHIMEHLGTPLTREDFKKDPERHAQRMISIVKHMHELGFVHRDIKPENWVLFEDDVMLVDLGFAIQINMPAPYQGCTRYASAKIMHHLNYCAPATPILVTPEDDEISALKTIMRFVFDAFCDPDKETTYDGLKRFWQSALTRLPQERVSSEIFSQMKKRLLELEPAQ